MALAASVAIVPGATALTRMPLAAHSTARCLVIPEATNLAGPYVDCWACPARPEIEDRQTMEPPGSSCYSMASTANLQVRNIPRPSTAITRSQSSGVASTMVLSGMMPALATSTSMRPKPRETGLVHIGDDEARLLPGEELGGRLADTLCGPSDYGSLPAQPAESPCCGLRHATSPVEPAAGPIDRLAWASNGGCRCAAHRPSTPGSL